MNEQVLLPDAPQRIQTWLGLPTEDRPSVLTTLAGGDGSPERSIADGWPAWLPDAIYALFVTYPLMPLEERSDLDVAARKLAEALAEPVDYGAARWRLMIALLTSMEGYEPSGAALGMVELHEQALAGDAPPAEHWGAARDTLRLDAVTFEEHALAALGSVAAEAAVLMSAWPSRRDRATTRVLFDRIALSKLAPADERDPGRAAECATRATLRRQLLAALHGTVDRGVARGAAPLPH